MLVQAPSKLRVLFFTLGGLQDGAPANGGTLLAQTHVQRLSEDSGINLHVVAVGPESSRTGTIDYLGRRGIRNSFIALNQRRPHLIRRTLWKALPSTELFFEAVWRANSQIAPMLQTLVDSGPIDWLVTESLYSAWFSKAVHRAGMKSAVVVANREAEFFAEYIKEGGTRLRRRWEARLAIWRAARFEQRIHAAADKVIALGKPDVPRRLGSKATWITPQFEAREPWRYRKSNTAFYVGNIAHYPNRRAVEYIATRLAARISASRPDVRIEIVGADADAVPAGWRHPIISYRGLADRETVERLFLSADLLLCPIENDFGMKLKVAEASAHGTPFLASRQTALCVPYLDGMPTLELSHPDDAAGQISRLVGDRQALADMSRFIRDRHQAFAESQKDIWSRTLAA